ncbi:MAG: M24 family metallopeptidase [Candidatus Margulisiibacteriota bacterium]
MENLTYFRQAAAISDQVFSRLVSHIRPGIREREIALFISKTALMFGCEKMSFKTLVASGARSAYPHGRPTNKKLMIGDLVFIDFGVKVNGFCSDCTRTFVLGNPTERQKRIYQIVLDAQERAIDKVKASVPVSEIDLAARNYIKQHRHGKYFIHSTGHGIRKRVHVKPRIHYKDNSVLKAGQIITIEPGIYIEDWGGVRIEDMVRVTDTGHEMLTKFDKKLWVIQPITYHF